MTREEIHKQALENVKDFCTLVLPMRNGKSKIGLEIAQKYNKVLVCYPSMSIYDSWLDTSEKFNLSIENITFVTTISFNKINLKEYDI